MKPINGLGEIVVMCWNPNYESWGTPTGWRCPTCSRVYSPNTFMCPYCGGNNRIINSPSTNPGDGDWWEEYLKKNTTGKPYEIWSSSEADNVMNNPNHWVEVTSSGAYILHGTGPEVYYGK